MKRLLILSISDSICQLKPPRSQIIEWAPYLLQLTIADMGVELSCSATAVA